MALTKSPKSPHAFPVDQEKKLKNFLSQLPALAAAYLYGSRASGQNQAASDWDLALLWKPGHLPSLEEKLKLQASLEELCGSDVDLVTFNEANPILKHQIYSYGKILLEKDSNFSQSFFVKSLNEYDDVKYMRRVIDASFSQGVLDA